MRTVATDRQIYDFIADYRREHGYSPTVREIGNAVGLRSTSTVHARLASMKAKGMISDGGDRMPRTIIPLDWSGEDADA